MLLLLSTAATKTDGSLFFKIILFIYFIPSMIALIRIPLIKFRFITVLLINLFFGWSVYGWWIAFYKAVSSSKE
ncbi:superinfection immunity protein [Chryseobacterium sp. SIMBA_038]|uniref:superinfection immunity protein n=1 Tax=Chryseobacterium sp. SIMBA_038 TaxID=3085780 RepID=UPI00397AD6EB